MLENVQACGVEPDSFREEFQELKSSPGTSFQELFSKILRMSPNVD